MPLTIPHSFSSMTTASSADVNENFTAVKDYVNASTFANPMDSAGDMIIGGADGAAAKLDAGTTGYILQAKGAAAPEWTNATSISIAFKGATDASSASTGYIGEYLLDGPTPGAVTLTGGAYWTVRTMTMPAGEWDIQGHAQFGANGGTGLKFYRLGFSTTTNTTPGSQASIVGVSNPGDTYDALLVTPPVRVRLSTETPYYLVAQGDNTAGNAPAVAANSAYISRRRVR